MTATENIFSAEKMGRSMRKSMENYSLETHSAFQRMCTEIDKERGGRQTYVLLDDGVYHLQ